jgi:hypothetical protein
MRTISSASLRPESSKAALERYQLELETSRTAIARRRVPEMTQAARRLLGALGSAQVQAELGHAAAAFAGGLDERPDAEEWVYFAVAARAALDQAAKSGAPSLGRELEQLDEVFEDMREAVLLLEPEDYKEALAATPPNTRTWWGERARLDAGLREIDLERALGELAG